jgi:hypothetical protein
MVSYAVKDISVGANCKLYPTPPLRPEHSTAYELYNVLDGWERLKMWVLAAPMRVKLVPVTLASTVQVLVASVLAYNL